MAFNFYSPLFLCFSGFRRNEEMKAMEVLPILKEKVAFLSGVLSGLPGACWVPYFITGHSRCSWKTHFERCACRPFYTNIKRHEHKSAKVRQEAHYLRYEIHSALVCCCQAHEWELMGWLNGCSGLQHNKWQEWASFSTCSKEQQVEENECLCIHSAFSE